jgi:guanine deaminase
VLSRKEGFEATEVDFKLAFWTATLGSATAIGLQDHLGSFGPGKQFDAILVSSAPPVYDIFPEAQRGPSSLKTDFERFVNLGDDRNVRKVYVRGRLVHTAV